MLYSGQIFACDMHILHFGGICTSRRVPVLYKQRNKIEKERESKNELRP